MMRGLGWLKDRPKLAGEKPDYLFTDHAARLGLAAAPPPADDLADLVLDVLDQGQLGSCVANAIMQAVRMRHVAQKVLSPILGSRLMTYYLARAAMHMTGVDSGTEPRIALSALRQFGFCPEAIWPYSDQNDSSARDPFKLMPPMAAFQAAFDQKSPTSYVRIASTGSQRLADVKSAIAGGYPVVFGCDVSNEFCRGQFDAAQPLTPPASYDVAGGHCMLFQGYSGDTFRVLNSWSAGFGDKGRILFAPEYVLACDDLWIIEHAPSEGEQ